MVGSIHEPLLVFFRSRYEPVISICDSVITSWESVISHYESVFLSCKSVISSYD